MSDELCDVQNDQYSRRQLEKDRLITQLGRTEPTSTNERVEHDILQAYGVIIRDRLKDPDWKLFDRHQWGGELYDAEVDADGCLIVGFIERRRFEPPRHAKYVRAEFVGNDLLVQREWDSDKPKE